MKVSAITRTLTTRTSASSETHLMAAPSTESILGLLDDRRWEEAASLIEVHLSRTKMKRAVYVLTELLLACKFRSLRFEDCLEVLTSAYSSLITEWSPFRAELLILANQAEQAASVCKSSLRLEISAEATTASRLVLAFALIMMGRTSEANAVVDLAGFAAPTQDHLRAMIHFYEGDYVPAMTLDPGISRYNRALYAYYNNRSGRSLCNSDHPEASAISNLNQVSGFPGNSDISDAFTFFNHTILASHEPNEGIVEFLEKEESKPTSTLYEAELQRFATANLLLRYVEVEEFVKASDLFARSDIDRLQRCFVDPDAFLYMKYSIHCQTDLTRPAAVKELSNLVHEKLSSAIATQSLLGLVCVLGRAFYDSGDLKALDQLLAKAKPIFGNQPEFIVNAGNSHFVQGQYSEAAAFYKQLIDAALDAGKPLLDLPAGVLASYCVALIVADHNEQAEDVLSLVQREEETSKTTTSHVHSTVINIVIGHLYCGRENWEFGLDRVMEALSGDDRVNGETWLYAKQALMAFLAVVVSCQTEPFPDEFVLRLVRFLETITRIPGSIPTVDTDTNVQAEARTVLELTRRVLT